MRSDSPSRGERSRRTHQLVFPTDLKAESVKSWLCSISGLLGAGPLGLITARSIAFELWATDRGMTHRLRVPVSCADYMAGQLRTLVPGVSVMPDREPEHGWNYAVELGETNPSRSLRIASEETLCASLLASVQMLGTSETVLYQIVVIPAVPQRPPAERTSSSTARVGLNLLSGLRRPDRDEINDRRARTAEPNMLAVIRLAARAGSDERAKHLVQRVQQALAGARSPHTRLKRRLVPAGVVHHRVAEAAGLLTFPMQLSVTELTALLAWPIGSPHVAGLPQSRARQLPATGTIPRSGRILGRSNFPGNERPIAISHEDACKHLHVIGPTGVGKTTLLTNLIVQDIEQGYGAVMIESKGDLFHATLDRIPASRINDVIVLDVNDGARPVGFNILNEGDPRLVVDELCALFALLYRDTSGVYTREVLYHGLHTLVSRSGLTFVDLAALLAPMADGEMAWREDLISALTDKELRQFWQRFMSQPKSAQERIVQPVLDRIWQLNARPEIRNIIGQSTSSFTMKEVIAGNKILLVNLAGVGQATASLTGTLLMNALWGAIRSVTPKRANYLYLDEFQDFLNLPVNAEDMLAKARGYRLGMTLAHQHLAQLPPDMRQAVLANARSKVVFQTTADDARTMAREFGRPVDDADFMNLGIYEAIARIATGGGVSSPVTLATLPPGRRRETATKVRVASRLRYGRPIEQVEAEMQRRRQPTAQTTKRPKLGPQKWG